MLLGCRQAFVMTTFERLAEQWFGPIVCLVHQFEKPFQDGVNPDAFSELTAEFLAHRDISRSFVSQVPVHRFLVFYRFESRLGA